MRMAKWGFGFRTLVLRFPLSPFCLLGLYLGVGWTSWSKNFPVMTECPKSQICRQLRRLRWPLRWPAVCLWLSVRTQES